MTTYITGALTTNPHYTEHLDRAEDFLQREYPSADIINPALVNSCLPKSTTHEEYMRMSFCMLDMADAIFMISNWKTSCGASQEYGYALAKDMIIIFEQEMENVKERFKEMQRLQAFY